MGKEPPYQVKHIKQIDRAQAHNMAQLMLSFLCLLNHDTQQIHFKIEKIFAPSKHNGHNQGKFT
jgi:hypothetical protein